MWEQVIINVGIDIYHGENKSKRTGATSGAGDAYPSGALVFTPDISGVPVAQSLLFCVVFYNSVVVLFLFFWSLYCVFLIGPLVSSSFLQIFNK